MDTLQLCYYTCVEALNHFRLHSTYITYVYKVLGHLLMLMLCWIGIWMHPHTITTTNIAADFGELADILGDGHVQTMPLHLC